MFSIINVMVQAILFSSNVAYVASLENPTSLVIGIVVMVGCNFLIAIALFIQNQAIRARL